MTYELKPSAKALIEAYDEFLIKKARIEAFAELLDLSNQLINEIASDRYHRAFLSNYCNYVFVVLTLRPQDSIELVLPFIEGMTNAGYGYVTDELDAENNARELKFWRVPGGKDEMPHVFLQIYLGESLNCVRKVVGYKTIPATVMPERKEPIYEIECREGATLQRAMK